MNRDYLRMGADSKINLDASIEILFSKDPQTMFALKGVDANVEEMPIHNGYYWSYMSPHKYYYKAQFDEFPTPEEFEFGFKAARSLIRMRLTIPNLVVRDFFNIMNAAIRSMKAV